MACLKLTSAALASVLICALALSHSVRSDEQKPTLRKTALEQRLDKLREVAFGASKVEPVAMPLNEGALRKYLDAYRQENRQKGSSVGWEAITRHNWALFAIARNQLGNEVPPRDGLGNAIHFYDLTLSLLELSMTGLRYHLDTLSSYTAFQARSELSMSEDEEARLMKHLDLLQSRLESRIAASKTLFWEHESKSQADLRERETAEREALEARRILPESARKADMKSLQELSTQWENEIFNKIIPQARVDYPSFLAGQGKTLQKQLPTLQKLSWTDNRWRTWEAKLFYTCDELCNWTDRTALHSCNLLWLHTSRGMFQRSYGESKGRMPDSLDLPDWREQEVFFREAGRKDIQRFRNFLDALQKSYSDSSIWIDVEDWWTKHGKDIPPRLFDAVIQDATDWLEDVPATRQVFHEEISRLAGVPKYKERFDRLTAEEQKRGQHAVSRTLKDVMKEFDASAVQRVREDLEVLEYMLKTYPPETLAIVKVEKEDRSPRERLKIQHVRLLEPRQAAKTYTELHGQMNQDVAKVSQEFRKMMLGFSLNVTFHARAAAKE